MPESTTAHLSSVVAVCDKILQSLDFDATASRPYVPQAVPLIPLADCGQYAKDLLQVLRARNLNERVCLGLQGVFIAQASAWRQEIQQNVSQLLANRHMDFSESVKTLMLSAVSARYVSGLGALRANILEVLEQKYVQYLSDAASAAEESESEHDMGSYRCHSYEAVAILERAYAHTTNITQAEKVRLAQATGLDPRQVIIWFQNRRNRKVKSKRAYQITPPESVPSPPGRRQSTPERKRKNSCNDVDEGPRYPSELASKKPRVVIDEAPPPIDRRLFSSSTSSSSFDSTLDSLSSWTGGQGSKSRNHSSESIATSVGSPLTASSATSSAEWGKSQQFQQHGPQLCDTHSRSSTLHLPPLEQQLAEGYLFVPGSDIPRLDFEDLGLDPNLLEESLQLDFNFLAPNLSGSTTSTGLWRSDQTDQTPGSTTSQSQRTASTASTSAAQGQSAPAPAQARNLALGPWHMTDVAAALNDGDFDLLQALKSIEEYSHLPAQSTVRFDSSASAAATLEKAFAQELKQGYLVVSPTIRNAEYCSSSPSSSTNAVMPSSFTSLASDFTFDFSLDALGLNVVFDETRESYRLAESEWPFDSSGTEVEDSSMSCTETEAEDFQGRHPARLAAMDSDAGEASFMPDDKTPRAWEFNFTSSATASPASVMTTVAAPAGLGDQPPAYSQVASAITS